MGLAPEDLEGSIYEVGCFRYTSFGYGYRDFFEFRSDNISPNHIFYFNFYVKTVSDAHILLKSSVSGNESIEIVIGGGSNTFSQIRLLRNEDKKTILTQKTENILSEINYRKFLISVDNLGIVFVKDENDVFLSWRFDNLFPIKYYAFGSWTNTKADWKFGCDKNTEIIHDDSQITPLQKLKNDLFTLYNPNTMPNGPKDVLQVTAEFHLDNIHMKWNDNKMKWNPDNYDGIDHLFIPPFQIWTPYLRVLNTLIIEKTPLFDLTTSGVIVTHDGSIFWRPPFKSVSFCEIDLKNWPYDTHNCSVLIGFWMEPPNLLLSMSVDQKTVDNTKIGSEWGVERASSLNNKNDDDDDNYGILYLEIRRNSESQVLLLTVPCMASDVLSLSSFWISFNNPNKFYLSCGSVIMLLVSLLLMGQSIPTMTLEVPKISEFFLKEGRGKINLYSWSVVIACFPILVFVILKNFTKSLKLSESMERMLNNNFLDRFCCLPELPLDVSEYGNLNEETNKMRGNEINSIRLISIIEKIFFLIYVCILTVRYMLL
ncbi:Neuronal acetylcholine receptor protein subunit alpha-5 precursor, putative [Pediculus humanus corporis]|uniref:Neuronal acetylcholine receptor protein subunit alpha-5, putative n=1 Tax=Pediculus humanus subsp. corporis TaxID=121224 RepID=E0VC57_PEDHC|nr:Neuronal acetylcholine receptor protein subunit alpha-5 precursor, putative [Pediculus humanus corporis]EEB10963.1 Neuronal acetylcholine receptor protein subunit alpha-5 precursor, putative [Pediculus humanus corporis]